jgi:translation initiation factor 1 (eIF-1/SUI1)
VIKVKRRTKRKFVTSVTGFEHWQLDPTTFLGELRRRFCTNCSTKRKGTEAKLIVQGDFSDQIKEFLIEHASVPADRIVINKVRQAGGPAPPPPGAAPRPRTEGQLSEPPWKPEVPRPKIPPEKRTLLVRSSTDDLPPGTFEDVPVDFHGDVRAYVRTMRAFVLREYDNAQAEKAKLILEHVNLEFEPQPLAATNCSRCGLEFDPMPFLLNAKAAPVCPNPSCETVIRTDLPDLIHWVTRLTAPDWFFMTDQERDLREVSNSHVNNGDEVMLEYRTTNRDEGKMPPEECVGSSPMS